MNSFENYFSLYEATDPPPIITEGYKLVQDNYRQYLNPSAIQTTQQIPDISFSSQTENPLSITTEPPGFKFIDSLEEDTTPSPDWSYGNPAQERQAQSIVNLARQFVGTKYQWGGMTPSTGFDCSGLVQYVYKQNGINLPRTVKDLEKAGTEVPTLADVQIGDLICTPGSGKSGKHIKIVSRIEDGQIFTIEAKGKKDGIIETPLTNTSNITTIRRVLNQQSNNFIVDYFVSKGLTRNQAKGIYGNLMQESRGNIRAVSSDGNNSYGLAQWTGPRKQKLFSMYDPNPTARQQLDFLWWELNNTHKDALTSLRRTSTVSDATRVFMNQFERPHKDYANFSKRLKYANSIV